MLRWPDEAACSAWAAGLAQRLIGLPHAQRDALIALHGELGAGKTTLVRHLLRALGFTGRVRSPTYTVLEPYALALPDGHILGVAHLDLYRLADPRELLDAGLDETLRGPGLKLIEWPERAGNLLGRIDLELTLVIAADDSRELQALALTARGGALVA